MRLWIVPVCFSILAIVVTNSAFLISISAGYVDSCLPYLDGCTSISRAARHGLGAILFKLTILPVMTLLLVYWIISYMNLVGLSDCRTFKLQTMLIAGIFGSLFGMLYTAFLGSEGDIYRFLRRIGVYIFFLGTYSAQVIEVLELRSRSLHDSISVRLRKWVMIINAATIFVAGPYFLFLTDDDWMENVLEWNISLLLFLYFILSGLYWREIDLSIELGRKNP